MRAGGVRMQRARDFLDALAQRRVGDLLDLQMFAPMEGLVSSVTVTLGCARTPLAEVR